MNIQIIIPLLSEWLGAIAVTMLLGLSPRFKQARPLVFLYPRRETGVSITLFVVILALAFALYGGLQNPAITGFVEAMGEPATRLAQAGLALIPFVLALAWRRQPLRSAGWNRALLGAALRLGIALIFLTLFLRGAIFRLLDGISPQEGSALLIWLGICLAEESIFRGYLQLRLSSMLGSRNGWLATAALFTLWHAPRLLAAPQTLLLNLAFTAIQGLLLGWIAQKSRHVLGGALYRTASEWITFMAST